MIRPAGAHWMAAALLTGLFALPSIGVAKPAAKHGAAKVAKVGKKGAAPHAAPRKAAPAPAAGAQPKERAATVSAPAPAAARAGDDGDGAGGGGTTASAGTGGKVIKTKTYSFTSMDVEGKLKTPQLLYFLNRVKLELDMSAPDKRSFMKELQQSADDKNL